MPTTLERPPASAAPAIAAGVIKEARARRRKRRLAVAFIVSSAGIALLLGVLTGARRQGPAAARHPIGTTILPSVVFAEDPYMGVSCRVPNWIGCDRLGLSVKLRRPARAVIATVAGATFRLDDRSWSGPEHDGRRVQFAGFLRHAGLVSRIGVKPLAHTQSWTGAGTPTPRVTFVIDFGGGQESVVQERVPLMAGWG